MSHVTGPDLIRIKYVPAEPKHLLRPLALFWARLGSLQIYFVAVLAIVLVLAGLGLWHLVSPLKQTEPATANPSIAKATPQPEPPTKPSPSAAAIARISPGIESASPTPVSPALERQIAIIDLTQEERRGPRGEELVIGTIGLTSRTDVEKSNVEIAVFFFDLTPTNEMRPTKAQVTYRWLTPIRDWSDPEPKYLAATYLKPPSSLSRRSAFAKADPRRIPDDLRYGGFIVRVYSDGKLQDERSQPETLISQLRPNASQQPAGPSVASVSPPPPVVASQGPPDSPTNHQSPVTNHASVPPPAQSSTIHQSPVTDHASDSLPNGILIPGKPGFVSSPYDPKFLIDVRGFPPGTLVIDPNTNKPFRVP